MWLKRSITLPISQVYLSLCKDPKLCSYNFLVTRRWFASKSAYTWLYFPSTSRL